MNNPSQPAHPAFHVRFIIDQPGVGQPGQPGQGGSPGQPAPPQQFDVAVAAGQMLDANDGEPGSLLQIALSAGVPIEHACGGVGVCATCHVIVEQGFESLVPAGEDEEDKLGEAAGVTRRSRLACLAVPTGSADLVVRVPTWNRNA